MERRRLRFTGRVQGVGFRATARAIARGCPISGWVRNEPDGSVLVEVQGESPALDIFLDALRHEFGPLITTADEQSIGILENESAFEVRR